ncbi:MAG: S-methyl-5'-thioinosine phosphorylase [Pseudomonadales bacterium]
MASIGVIRGSGALDWDVDWRELGDNHTDFGDGSARPVIAEVGGREVVAMARHGEPHRYAPHAVNYRANLKLLERHGVGAIVALNTVGGIGAVAETGALIVPDQIIDYTWGRIQSFSPEDAVRHIDFSEPFDGGLRAELLRAGEIAGIRLHDGGVMGVTQGPRLETAAEIARMDRDGCAVVGMTGMPEAVLARELGIPYASLSLVVNPAAGLSDSMVDLDEIRAVSEQGMTKIAELLGVFFQILEGFD